VTEILRLVVEMIRAEPRTILRNDLNARKNRSDWDYYVTNPSAALLPNGTVMLVSHIHTHLPMPSKGQLTSTGQSS
jgi:hypothetical protein